ncbi:prepilin peptidase [Candidatus Falkowbacteria bacterium]|nr:prepilin peptidase [Candidatus Falkowbacteria bacterium]
MTVGWSFIFFVGGLILGSFLNSVIWRLQAGKSLWERHSVCPVCRQALAGRDLVPLLSFIRLGGRCRYCRDRISWQYPAVELATAAFSFIFYWHFGLTLRLALAIVFLAFLMVIAVYDLRYSLILDVVTIPAMILAWLGNVWLGEGGLRLLLAGIVGGGFFLLQFVVSRGRWIGGGDIRLGSLMGLMLGWPQILVALMLAYVVGAFVSLSLVVAGKKQMASTVPFGAWLSAATVVTLLWGQLIIQWYVAMLW